MAIDPKDVRVTWENLSKTMSAPKVEYRTVEMSSVWADLVGWTREALEKREASHEQAKQALSVSGDYSHAGLAKLKSLLDITHAEVLLLQEILQKMEQYHQRAD